MRRAFGILLLIGALVYGAAFITAPWFAFRALRAAAQASDIQTMAELIDFSAVRQSLQDQVDSSAQTPPPDVWRDPLGAMRRALAPLAPSKDMDVYLTPRRLVALTAGLPDKPGAKPGVFSDLFPGHGRSIRYWDPKRCRIAVTGADGHVSLFTFERRGQFDWKLVQLRLNDQPAG
jgi:hypothetical protein